MRKTYKRVNLKEINQQMIVIGCLFIVSIVLGAYLNKIWPSTQNNIINNIDPIIDYYNSSEGTLKAVISNLKIDTVFMVSISILTLLVITFPIAIVIFMLKGLSVGYTINSTILALEFKSIKFIVIMLIKNLIIIPGIIILGIISFNYIQQIIHELKKGKKDKVLFLVKRYLLNAIIIICITVLLQSVLNLISIGVTKFLVR